MPLTNLSHIATTTTLNCTSNLTMEWQALSSALLIASQSTLGNLERRHQDWFNDNSTDIRSLIQDKNAAHYALLRNPTSRTLRACFSSKRATVRFLRWQAKVDGEQLVGGEGGSDTELCQY